MISKKRFWLLTLVPCAIGVLITVVFLVNGGKAVQAAKSPTDLIRVAVYPGGVYLAPNSGDVVQWIRADDPTADVYVHFVGSSPCTGKKMDTDVCVIRKKAKGTFRYYCTDDRDGKGTVLCKDPGVDPNSSVGDGLYTANKPASNGVNSATFSRTSAEIGKGSADASVDAKAEDLSLSGKGVTASFAPAAKFIYTIACDKNDKVVMYDSRDSAPVPPVAIPSNSSMDAKEKDTAEWDFDDDLAAKVDFNPTSNCPVQPVGQALVCTIGSGTANTSISYKISAKCGAARSSDTFYFKVLP